MHACSFVSKKKYYVATSRSGISNALFIRWLCTQVRIVIVQFLHTRRFIAAEAPADAISCCLALTLLVTRGRPLFPGARTAPVLVRLLPAMPAVEAKPFTADCLLEAAGIGLLGLVPEASRCLTAVPFLKVVAGGSGSGRPLVVGVAIVFIRLMGDSFLADKRPVGIETFCPVMNSCRTASSGFKRLSGSHRRQRVKKSRNGSSSHLRTCCKVLEDGRRLFPFDETVRRGFPSESKKSFRRVLLSIRCFSGGPKTSMMQASCSCSFSPGNMGTPVYNSAKIQPTLHISIGIP